MAKSLFRAELAHTRTVVVKVGSRILTASDHLARTNRVRNLVEDIVALRKKGVRVLLVSSGAIAHGVLALDLPRRPTTIPMQQACASIGQIRLMHMYETLFGRRGVVIGQVLLSWDDLRDKQRYLNLRNTLFQLWDSSVVPIINENDSVGVDEIRFGDNDTLGAQIALLVGAQLFVIMTDIDGLYTSNPRTDPHAVHIPIIEKITSATHRLAGGAGSDSAVGGMTTKLRAAEMVTKAGRHAIIGDGYKGRLAHILKSKDTGTVFMPSTPTKMSARRRWIAFSGDIKGSVTVDCGAKAALTKKGKSLLPAGVKRVTGAFKVGDMIEINDEKGKTFAKGMTNYASRDVEKIRGRRTKEFESCLGAKSFDEVIHRDNMALI